MAQGKLTEAQTAYRENLAISRRLAEQDPSNAGWQRELAAAHGQVGNVLQMQGDLTAAEWEYSEFWEYSAGWRRRILGMRFGKRFGGGAQPRGRGAGDAG